MAGNPSRELLTRTSAKTATADQAEETQYLSSKAGKALQQRAVVCVGRDRAQKTLRPSTAVKEASSRDDSSYHWIQTSEAERVGLPPCNGFSTISFSHRFRCTFIFHLYLYPLCFTSSPAAMGDWRKQQVEVTTGSCSQEPARRRPWTSGRSFSVTGAAEKIGSIHGD